MMTTCDLGPPNKITHRAIAFIGPGRERCSNDDVFLIKTDNDIDE